MVKYLNVELSSLIQYKKDYLELYIYSAKQMYDPRIKQIIGKNKEIEEKTKYKYINLLENGTYISLDLNPYNNFVINSSISKKISNEKLFFYLISFKTMKLIEEPAKPTEDIKEFNEKQKLNKEKSISVEEFYKLFLSMSKEKEIYIKSRIIKNSGLLDKISNKDTLMFNLEKNNYLISKTKEEILNDMELFALTDISNYDVEDKNYFYKIKDCSI
ncbi:hypothetical protein M2S00_07320 [Apilactobacillus sp. TMW 2.2459]|nr:hypothetical protein [Apilactobacillus xinyiensis]